MIGNGLVEHDASLLERRYGSLDVVAVERHVMRPRRRLPGPFHGVTADVGFRKVEDQPAIADVGVGESKLVAQEGPRLLGLGRVE